MKQILIILVLSYAFLLELRAQSFVFTKDVHVIFVSADSGSCEIAYTTNSNPAITVNPAAALPNGFALSSNPFTISAKSPSGSFHLNYPAGIAGLVSIKLFAFDGVTNVDATEMYFIPEAQKNTFVVFGPNSIDSIDEPKDGVSSSKNVIATIHPILPFNSNFTLSIDYAKSDFPGVTSAVTQTVSYIAGSQSSLLLPITIQGTSRVKDDRQLVFQIKDQHGHIWDADTVSVKSYENSLSVKSLRSYMSLGGSYDFLRGVDRPLSAYSELYVRSNDFSVLNGVKQTNRAADGKSNNHWSLSGHYYSATVVSTRDTISKLTEHIPFKERGQDTLNVVRGFGNQVRVNSSNFYTLAGRINYNLFPHLGDEHQFLAYINFEGLVRKSELKYANVDSPTYDTVSYALEDLPQELGRYSFTDPSLNSIVYKRTRFEGYGGIGLRYEWETDELQFIVDAGFGFATYDLRFYSQAGFPNMSSFYYNNEFSIIIKSIGVKFGGDVRSKFNPGNSNNVDRWRPLGTIYLAKTLSVKKIGDFIKDV